VTQFCDHRHADVGQHACGLCWLRLEGDQDLIDLRVLELDAPGYENMACVPLLLGWDACRDKHIEEAKAA
jgi:hypothetical protein